MQPDNAACDHDWVISSVVPDTRVCVRCNATEPTPEPTPILVAPDAARGLFCRWLGHNWYEKNSETDCCRRCGKCRRGQ